ncbi:Dynein beta chain flagellar outer arm [Bienertia sinuspersici]
MKFGMQYAYEAGLRSLEVESDCSNLISLVKGSSSVRGHTQIIVDEIINKAGLMNYVSFNFAYHSCNKCAHSLAKLALDYDEVLVWMEESPEAVTPLVLADILI